MAAAHCLQCEVLFDKNRIVTVDRLAARFPHDGEEKLLGGREKYKDRLTVHNNEIL